MTATRFSTNVCEFPLSLIIPDINRRCYKISKNGDKPEPSEYVSFAPCIIEPVGKNHKTGIATLAPT